MDLQIQDEVKRLSDTHGARNMVIVLGAPDAESAEIAAETFVFGDPAYAGALAGVQLDLAVYHVLEDAIKQLVAPEVWDEQIGVMEDVLDRNAIVESVTRIRHGHRPG